MKPIVSNVMPTPGTTLNIGDAVSCHVTDNTGRFRRVILAIAYATSGVTEMVHDGESFLGHYAARSSRTLITDGFQYTIRRTGGWTSALGSPTLRVWAIDEDGNEAD